MTLDENERERYSRQMILKEVGEEGQIALSKAKAVIVGCGALGCGNANNLVRAGVGRLRLIDRDLVESNNLHRQLLLDEDDIGRPKAIACADKLRKINTIVDTEPVVDDVNRTNIERLMDGFDLVIDGTDNLETRFLINDACVKSGVPWVYGAAVGTYGLSMNILPGDGPCLSCIAPELPNRGTMETCNTRGIINTMPLTVASIQSTEAMKILMGKEPNRTLLAFDIWKDQFHHMHLSRDENCICCGERRYVHLDSGPTEIITSLCGTDTIQIVPVKAGDIDLDGLAARLTNAGRVEVSEGCIRLNTNDYRIDIFGNGRVIIHGTEDEKVARSLMAQYLGV